MTGSGSVTEKLLPRVRETNGTGGPGAEGGTMTSGSKKYIHLVRGSVHNDVATRRPCNAQMDVVVAALQPPILPEDARLNLTKERSIGGLTSSIPSTNLDSTCLSIS